MMENKRGMSAVITTLIIILLVIVALGIIWVVVKNVIDSGVEQVEWAEKCRPVEVQLVKINETLEGNYAVTLTRTSAGDTEIDGIRMVVSDGTKFSDVIEFSETLNKLETKTDLTVVSLIGTDVEDNVTLATQLEMTPYFVDDLGEEHLCETRTEEF